VRRFSKKLSEGWSRVIQHDLTGKLDGHSWTVDFPVYIDCTYLNGKYDENGVARHGYAADAPFIDSPRDARYHYSKRFGIESSYRLFEQAIATTTTRDPTVRLLYVVVSLLYRTSGGTFTTSMWRRPAEAGVASGGGETATLTRQLLLIPRISTLNGGADLKMGGWEAPASLRNHGAVSDHI